MRISKTRPCKFLKFPEILLIFSWKLSCHISSYIATNVKDVIHATLTVLPQSLWWLHYRWVKCGKCPTLLPAFYPLSHPHLVEMFNCNWYSYLHLKREAYTMQWTGDIESQISATNLFMIQPYLGCIHKVAQSRTERKPTIHKLLPAAQSDPETGVYERPVQPLQTHRATLVASRVRRCKHGGNIWICW